MSGTVEKGADTFDKAAKYRENCSSNQRGDIYASIMRNINPTVSKDTTIMLSKKKTFRIVLIFWNLGLGGVQKRIIEIIQHCITNFPDYTVIVLLKYKTLEEKRITYENKVHVEYFQDTKEKSPFKFFLWLLGRCFYYKPTHIVGFMYKSGVAAVIISSLLNLFGKNVKACISEEIFLSRYLIYAEKNSKIWKKIIQYIYSHADIIFVLTRAMKKDLVKEFLTLKNKIKIISPWIDLINFKKQKKLYDFIYVGRIEKEKGIDNIIELGKYSVAKKKKIKIGIVGSGSLTQYLKKQIQQENINTIKYLGYHPNPVKIIQRSKYLVLPSYNEGFPLVILEAFSVGVPVISSNFPGATEIIASKKNGFIVKKLSRFPKEAMAVLNGNNYLLMKKNASETAKRFSKKNLNNFLEVLTKI